MTKSEEERNDLYKRVFARSCPSCANETLIVTGIFTDRYLCKKCGSKGTLEDLFRED